MAILSIQSHVVYGYAGNSSAVFPLQRLGHEVWAVNTVEFSNHTGYGAWRGEALDAALTDSLVLGLRERGVLGECRAVLSGYLGSAESGGAIARAVRSVREERPDALYCCDPVMGDAGRGVYVKEGIPEMFKRELIPLATIITPNLFELGLLAGVDASTPEGARRALEAARGWGPRVILVTSFGRRADHPGTTGMLVSDASGGVWRVRTPEFDFKTAVAGSGDLTAAVFLARFLETGDARRSLELAAAAVFGIMEETFKAGRRELHTVAAQSYLDASFSGGGRFRAEPFTP